MDCQMLQIINGGATRFTRFSRPQYDEAVPAAVRKPMNRSAVPDIRFR